MDINDFSQLNPSFDPNEYQKQKTAQALGSALMQSGMQGQPQGQMVSGHYVAPSIFQRANQAAQMLGGMNMAQNAQGNIMSTDRANTNWVINGGLAKYLQDQKMLNPGATSTAFPAQSSFNLQTPLTADGSVLGAMLKGYNNG